MNRRDRRRLAQADARVKRFLPDPHTRAIAIAAVQGLTPEQQAELAASGDGLGGLSAETWTALLDSTTKVLSAKQQGTGDQ